MNGRRLNGGYHKGFTGDNKGPDRNHRTDLNSPAADKAQRF